MLLFKGLQEDKNIGTPLELVRNENYGYPSLTYSNRNFISTIKLVIPIHTQVWETDLKGPTDWLN